MQAGTGEKYVPAIDAWGVIPKSRHYVHLSDDIDTAVNVGSRHKKPMVYRVLAEQMAVDGMPFINSLIVPV